MAAGGAAPLQLATTNWLLAEHDDSSSATLRLRGDEVAAGKAFGTIGCRRGAQDFEITTHRAEAFMRQKRFDATKIHTHTFPLDDLPTAIRYAKDRVDDAIKVVVKAKGVAAHRVAAE